MSYYRVGFFLSGQNLKESHTTALPRSIKSSGGSPKFQKVTFLVLLEVTELNPRPPVQKAKPQPFPGYNLT